MDYFVKIDRIPEGVEFPPPLKDRIHFDADSHKLIFHGYMSKTDFDRLCQLSNDWNFRRAWKNCSGGQSPKIPCAKGNQTVAHRRHAAILVGIGINVAYWN